MMRVMDLNRGLVLWLVVLSLLGVFLRAEAHNNKTAYAIPLSGITIDGKLDDWPEKMAWYPILNHAQVYGPTDIDTADLTTSPDLSPSFTAGFSPEENLIYVAVRVRDDTVAVSKANWSSTDACEVIVEGPHIGEIRAPWSAAGDSPALVYAMWPPGGSYGEGMVSADNSANPNIMGGDITRTRTRGAYTREGDTCIYEWAVEPFDHYPDAPAKLEYGKKVGFEIFVTDKDRGTDNAACLTWAPFGNNKRIHTDLLGDLVLVKSMDPVGFLAGRIKDQGGGAPIRGARVEISQEGRPVQVAFTDSLGSYRQNVLQGTYTVRASTRGVQKEVVLQDVEVSGGKETAVDISLEDFGTCFYVDDDALDEGDGSAEHPFQTVQKALEATSEEDTVRARPKITVTTLPRNSYPGRHERNREDPQEVHGPGRASR